MERNFNNKLQNTVNYLSQQMQGVSGKNPSHNQNPVDNLTIDEIQYIQIYLDKIKSEKIKQTNQQKKIINRATDIYNPIEREIPRDWRNYQTNYQTSSSQQNNSIPENLCGTNITKDLSNNNSNFTEPGSRGAISTRYGKKMINNDNYYNPYEYGAKQNQINVPIREYHNEQYRNDPNTLDQIGLTQKQSNEKFPGQIRNVNVESYLLQGESTHLPGQREITQKDYNRFELLPFDPQDPKHIVWNDIPRGGISTRIDRMSN